MLVTSTMVRFMETRPTMGARWPWIDGPSAGLGVGGGEFAAEAVGVSDGEESEAHGAVGGEDGVVAYGVSGVQVAEAEDAGLPGHQGFEAGAEVGWDGIAAGGGLMDGETVAVERDAGAHHGACSDAGGQVAEPGEVFFGALVVESGGVAGVNPCWMKARCGYGCDGFFEVLSLRQCLRGVCYLGRGEVGEDAVESKVGLAFEPVEEGVEGLSGCDALTCHAGVDFEVDGQGEALPPR